MFHKELDGWIVKMGNQVLSKKEKKANFAFAMKYGKFLAYDQSDAKDLLYSDSGTAMLGMSVR